jgi:hypothetical protein
VEAPIFGGSDSATASVSMHDLFEVKVSPEWHFHKL